MCLLNSFLQHLEDTLADLQPTYHFGPLLIHTELFHCSLLVEIKQWKLAYGRSLNERCAREMDEMFRFFETMEKRLNRPVKDLDDVRSQMAALTEIRNSEIRIDAMITPIEEAYTILARYNLHFNDGNAERVDQLAYSWKLLKQKVK